MSRQTRTRIRRQLLAVLFGWARKLSVYNRSTHISYQICTVPPAQRSRKHSYCQQQPQQWENRRFLATQTEKLAGWMARCLIYSYVQISYVYIYIYILSTRYMYICQLSVREWLQSNFVSLIASVFCRHFYLTDVLADADKWRTALTEHDRTFSVYLISTSIRKLIFARFNFVFNAKRVVQF